MGNFLSSSSKKTRHRRKPQTRSLSGGSRSTTDITNAPSRTSTSSFSSNSRYPSMSSVSTSSFSSNHEYPSMSNQPSSKDKKSKYAFIPDNYTTLDQVCFTLLALLQFVYSFLFLFFFFGWGKFFFSGWKKYPLSLLLLNGGWGR